MTDPKAAKRAAMRRATLNLVAGVVVLDAVAMGLWYLVFKDTAPRPRLYFTVVWTVATALVVVVLLKRVRQARFAKY